MAVRLWLAERGHDSVIGHDVEADVGKLSEEASETEHQGMNRLPTLVKAKLTDTTSAQVPTRGNSASHPIPIHHTAYSPV